MKPFKGVICRWSFIEGRVKGICVHHTTHDNGIADGYPITTSVVESIVPLAGLIPSSVRRNTAHTFWFDLREADFGSPFLMPLEGTCYK